jgi:hypothetical protein
MQICRYRFAGSRIASATSGVNYFRRISAAANRPTPFGFRVRINPTHQFFGKVKFQPMGGSGWAALESPKLLF